MKFKTARISITMFIIMLILSSAGAEAKWWIFGQSEDDVNIQYLFLNKASFDETGSKITLYQEMLPDGKITITGKAVVGKGKVGGARISLDNKESWNDANLSEDGAFEYSFRPELGKKYVIYIEVSDTTGKTNDVKATYREVTVSDRNVMSIVKEALDGLIDAYQRHDAKTFMSLVSEDFAGDMTNLDRAIRKDFSSFDNISLRYTLNNVSSDSRGISVSLSFSRNLISTKSGQSLKDKGITEFVFKLGEKGAKVFSMKNPLIFGITDASNVATGTVKPMTSDPLIVVDNKGNAKTVSPDVFEKIVNNDGDVPSATVEKGGRILISTGHPPMGFSFVDGQVIAAAGDFMITGGGPGSAYGFLGAGVAVVDLGSVVIGAVTEAPASGYASGTGLNFVEGRTYAFKLANGKYGLMEVKSATEDWSGGVMTITMRFDYKYQPSGVRQFLP
ncbi:MAG: hypothetical protein C0394_01700 [Syntrophus sp. (in: bacteria)]|nr:hypothetical protein [Syntrophus sp. (in: bacteria)]